jgi:predicted nucleic acid-binding protein
MKVLFDTSVLVAAFEVSHPRHGICLPWLQRVQTSDIDGYVSTHTFAELYSVLTRLPVKPVISPAIGNSKDLVLCTETVPTNFSPLQNIIA